MQLFKYYKNMHLRKDVRLKGYDYTTNGYYFVTIVTHNRLPLLKDYKDRIETIIKEIPQFIKGVFIDYFTVMDNHIHIIFIFKDCKRPLGRVVAALKSTITKELSTKINMNNLPLWQWNYYEHIIRSDHGLQKIREYIINNPLAEILDWKLLDEKVG